MIIFGVLIIFVSARLRYKHQIDHEFVKHDLRYTNLAQVTFDRMKRNSERLRRNRVKGEEKCVIQDLNLSENCVEVFMIPESIQLIELNSPKIENESSTEHQMIALSTRINYDQDRLECESMDASRCESETDINDDDEIEEGQEANINNWNPDDIKYREGHQAAIEAALSTVLTVSTLVGFRVNEGSAYHCCLHHAVKVSLN